MACEDYPCCGHEPGDCPKINSKGQEIWTCVGCGKPLKANASSSYCTRKECMRRVRLQWEREAYGDY
jgi:hypothetical protein